MLQSKKTVSTCSAVLALALVLSACSGKGEEGTGSSDEGAKEKTVSNLNDSGFPIVKEPIQLTFFTGKAPTTANNWKETALWKEYAKMTNVNVDFQLVSFETMAEKRNLALASGDYPDAFHTTRLSAADLMQYGSQGTFVKLNDLIDKYAPNLKRLMDKYPFVKQGITMPDGNIYSFPLVYEPGFDTILISNKLWIQKEWLDKLNMPEPQTVDEFYNYLKSVKGKDLNGNGKDDEIPFGGVGYTGLMDNLKGAFGLMNRGVNHKNVDVDPKTNKLRFTPADDSYKQLLQFMNKLHSEGLLDKESVTIKSNPFYAKGAEGVYGATSLTWPSTLMNQNGYVVSPALKGPNGDRMYSNIQSSLVQVGAFVITDKNKYPEATVRWIDHFYGDEGSKMFFMGIKDVSYTESADGTIDYVDEIKKNPQGLTLEQAVVKYVTWPGGSYPGIVTPNYFKAVTEEMNKATDKLKPYMIKDIWPAFTFTNEEAEQLKVLSTDINTYVDQMASKFITGEAPFTEWENYVNTLKKMKIDDYLKVYQAAYDRYEKAK